MTNHVFNVWNTIIKLGIQLSSNNELGNYYLYPDNLSLKV